MGSRRSYDRTCVSCGNKFDSYHPHRLTCSELCRTAYKRQWDRDYHAQKRRDDPDMRRRSYRRKLEEAAADSGSLAQLREKQRIEREAIIAARDNDKSRRKKYLERERQRNSLRFDYRKEKRIERNHASALTELADITNKLAKRRNKR